MTALRIAGTPANEPDAIDARRWSPQQEAVFDWVDNRRGSAFVEAVAGSGKTTTLVEACRRMRGDVAFTAFNRKIADEIKQRTETFRNVRVGTFHSFGFAAWRRVAPKPTVDADLKTKQMLDAINAPKHLRSVLPRLLSIAKQSVVNLAWSMDDVQSWRLIIDHHNLLDRIEDGPWTENELMDDIIDRVQRAIIWSSEVGDRLIDFDDMLWLPLLHDAPVWRNDWVLVDEAQDTNMARRMLAERMVKPPQQGGRTLWVGDRNQAIYGFTGADSDAVDLIVNRFKCVQLPLSVTYRCSKRATALAQTWVPQITAHESTVEGAVLQSSRAGRWPLRAGGSIYGVKTGEHEFQAFVPGDAVLCRLTKPLVTLAFEMIREGVGCHVEGRDIGKNLDALISRWKVTTCEELTERLIAYQARETMKLEAREQHYAVEALNDKIETIFILMDGLELVADVRRRVDSMFKDTETGEARRTVTLSTVHKAKGREWNRVFILGYQAYMPSKWARKEWELQQEDNLRYVAVTRTKDQLILMPGLD